MAVNLKTAKALGLAGLQQLSVIIGPLSGFVRSHCPQWLGFRIREAIEASKRAARRVDPWPKYSPDLNPVEMSFSQMKAVLHKAGVRTIPARRRIRSFARTLTPRQAANYFRHAGYA